MGNVASSSKSILPLPKATSKRSLKVVDSESEPDEKNSDDNEDQSSDSDEGSDSGSLGDSHGDEEESDVDVDAPRVAQWVDEEELEQPEAPSGHASHKGTSDLEDIVRPSPVSPNSWFTVLPLGDRTRQ